MFYGPSVNPESLNSSGKYITTHFIAFLLNLPEILLLCDVVAKIYDDDRVVCTLCCSYLNAVCVELCVCVQSFLPLELLMKTLPNALDASVNNEHHMS